MYWGAIVIVMMAMFSGGGYFFAAKYENRGLLANLFESSEKLIEEIPLDPIAYEKYKIVKSDFNILKSDFTRGENISNQKTEQKNFPKDCVVKSGQQPLYESVILNEIAWMGTADSANNEWIELKNISEKEISISGWMLKDKDEQINIVFPAKATIVPRGFYLLAREEAEISDTKADMFYKGGLRNSEESIHLFNGDCDLEDEVIALDDWPAGDNKEKKTMERGADFSWHTSQIVNGTPGKENMATTTTTAMTMTITITTTTATSSNVAGNNITQCTSTPNNIPFYTVLINEIAWAGTASDKTSHEWIELRNTTGDVINLNGWKLMNKNENINVVFGADDLMDIYGYYLLERTDDDAVLGVAADKIFTSAIRNSDEFLKLIDNQCALIDEVVADNGSGKEWHAGTASPDYRTAERSADFTWHTYSGNGAPPAGGGIFGTPKTDNSPIVILSGGSSPGGGSSSGDGGSPPPPPPPPSPQSGPVLISEVMVGMDGNADYEFIELYNLNTFDITLTDWTMKKKSSSGTESSLVAASRFENKIIKAGKYILLAQDEGYTGSIVPDIKWPSSYSLAYTNNTVEIFNASGEKIDETNWTEISKGKSFERDSWTSNRFHIQDIPNPQNSSN